MSDPTSGGPGDQTPPVPPAPPQGQPTQYGQYPAAPAPQAPGYGAPAPVYGQPAPDTSQPANPYGTPAYPAYGAAPAYGGYAAPKTNTLAIVSLVSSLVGLFVIPFIGSIVGIITGHMSLSQIKRTQEQGRGIGLAGTIVGWVGLGLAIIGTIALIAWISWFTANYEDFRTM